MVPKTAQEEVEFLTQDICNRTSDTVEVQTLGIINADANMIQIAVPSIKGKNNLPNNTNAQSRTIDTKLMCTKAGPYQPRHSIK